MSRREKLRLGAFLYPGGHHVAAWRHPQAQADAGVNPGHYKRLAQAAERAKFDLIFLADGVSVRGDDIDALSRTATDRKSTRLNSSHTIQSRMPSSA